MGGLRYKCLGLAVPAPTILSIPVLPWNGNTSTVEMRDSIVTPILEIRMTIRLLQPRERQARVAHSVLTAVVWKLR